MKKIVIGIDVGGTNIKVGLVDHKGHILDRTNLITKSFVRDRNALIAALADTINELIRRNNYSNKNILGIGIGLPGLINPPHGVVYFLPNIPGWKNVPLKKILEEKLHIPVFIENDVNIITLAEWKFGAGIGRKNMVCITLGTGVGGGLILNNELYQGEGFVAGEIGHIPINEEGPKCNCGGKACFERYVGNHYLQQKINKIFPRQGISIQDMRVLAEKGNKKALDFWFDTATHIGNGLIGVVNLLNPTCIVIGGGVSNNYKFLFKRIEEIIKKRAMRVQSAMVKIVRAQLGDDAGIIGGYVLVTGIQSTKSRKYSS